MHLCLTNLPLFVRSYSRMRGKIHSQISCRFLELVREFRNIVGSCSSIHNKYSPLLYVWYFNKFRCIPNSVTNSCDCSILRAVAQFRSVQDASLDLFKVVCNRYSEFSSIVVWLSQTTFSIKHRTEKWNCLLAEATRSVLMTLQKNNDISNERVIDSNDVMM